MTRLRQKVAIHAALLLTLALTMAPFALVVNNSLRTNPEIRRSAFAPPSAVVESAGLLAGGYDAEADAAGGRGAAIAERLSAATEGYERAWRQVRPYVLNTIIVAAAVAAGVVALGSVSAFVLATVPFRGRGAVFGGIVCFLMVPAVLTLVPSFLLVKDLGLINSYWVLILPYVAGGQVLAIFLFRAFFQTLPGELLEAARLDGASPARIFWDVVLPLSKPIISVVLVVNVLGVWNNFLWPFVANSDPAYHVIASGLFVLANSSAATDSATVNAAFVLSALPLLALFLLATKPFMTGVTGGAFKA